MADELWYKKALQRIEAMPVEAKAVRENALNDLYYFACLMNPNYMYGEAHKDVFRWLQSNNDKNQFLMLPRAHLKSHCIAVWCCWWLTKHPDTSIVYVSATAELAERQLDSIKNMMLSDKYQLYFPDMLNPEEGRRSKWSATKINVDHPKRRKEGVRDSTIATAGITTNTTGWHANVLVYDDLVVPDNAYTDIGRTAVAAASSQLTSVLNAGGIIKACGTRYHPSDVYATWKEQHAIIYDEDTGDELSDELLWDIKEHPVESNGVFLWPRVMRTDGNAFGFNRTILARIKASYIDITQFFAQYYNDPNDPSSQRINSDKFQYYDSKFLKFDGSNWTMHGKRLNVYASIDFAFSLSKAADFTAIVVVGIDADGNVYVLDIDRFKTDKISEYFKHVKDVHMRWGLRKLRAEVTVAQKIIVNDIKDSFKKEGLPISIDEYRPTKAEGTKEERIAAVLEPRYDDLKIWHSTGGYTPILEEELVQARPKHDDLKDALASVIEIAIKPKHNSFNEGFSKNRVKVGRFGGVSFGKDR